MEEYLFAHFLQQEKGKKKKKKKNIYSLTGPSENAKKNHFFV